EAAVLVDDPRLDRVVGGAVVVAAGGRGARAGRVRVGRTREVAVVAVVGVVEAGRGVGVRRVELVREADRRGGALVDRAARRQVGGRGDVEIGRASCREGVGAGGVDGPCGDGEDGGEGGW